MHNNFLKFCWGFSPLCAGYNHHRNCQHYKHHYCAPPSLQLWTKFRARVKNQPQRFFSTNKFESWTTEQILKVMLWILQVPEFSYYVGDWSSCSATCETGNRQREAPGSFFSPNYSQFQKVRIILEKTCFLFLAGNMIHVKTCQNNCEGCEGNISDLSVLTIDCQVGNNECFKS